MIQETIIEKEGFDSGELEDIINRVRSGEYDSVRVHDFVRATSLSAQLALLEAVTAKINEFDNTSDDAISDTLSYLTSTLEQLKKHE